MAEHWLVHRRVVRDGMGAGWSLSVADGSPTGWRTLPGGADRKRWAKEALDTAYKSGMGCDVTIAAGSASVREVMADPDALDPDQTLAIICRDRASDQGRFALLNMDRTGVFSLARIVIGPDIERLFQGLIACMSDGPFDNSVLWVRPGWLSTDLLPRPCGLPVAGAQRGRPSKTSDDTTLSDVAGTQAGKIKARKPAKDAA